MVQSVLGLVAFILIAWLISENRRKVSTKIILGGLLLQLIIAISILKFPFLKSIFFGINRIVELVQKSTLEGTKFVFGYIGGDEVPFEVKPGASTFILATQTLPLVIIISVISSILFYWRVLPFIVRCFSYVLRKATGISGALGLGVASNIFLGMVESPLMIKPYVSRMTRSEIFAIMTSGMATISGTVMFLYAAILDPVVPDALGHILIASLISAPAAVLIAMTMVPETEKSAYSEARLNFRGADSTMDALVKGVDSGLKIFLNIIAMIIVLISLVALIDKFIAALFPSVGGQPLSLERLLGYIMAPLVWLAGVPWKEALTAGQLMGTKTILNELVAYTKLASLPACALSAKSRLIMTYAMCGFANFGSLGIMIAGFRVIAPERQKDVLSLGIKSIIAGTLATLMTGAVVGVVL